MVSETVLIENAKTLIPLSVISSLGEAIILGENTWFSSAARFVVDTSSRDRGFLVILENNIPIAVFPAEEETMLRTSKSIKFGYFDKFSGLIGADISLGWMEVHRKQ